MYMPVYFLLPLVNAAWLCLGSVIMVSRDISSGTEHLRDRTCRSKESVFHLLQSPIPDTIPMVSCGWATRSHSQGAVAAGMARAHLAGGVGAGAGRPAHPAAPKSVAAWKRRWKNSLEKAQSYHKTATVRARVKSEHSMQSHLSTSVCMDPASVCYD